VKYDGGAAEDYDAKEAVDDDEGAEDGEENGDEDDDEEDEDDEQAVVCTSYSASISQSIGPNP
jgi:hypothetical protein